MFTEAATSPRQLAAMSTHSGNRNGLGCWEWCSLCWSRLLLELAWNEANWARRGAAGVKGKRYYRRWVGPVGSLGAQGAKRSQ